MTRTGDRPSNWPTASTCSSTTPITLRRSMKTRRGRGHCSDAAAVALAREAGVCKIVLFHRHPDHNDDVIDGIVSAHTDGDLSVEAAAERTEYVLEPS